MVDIDPVTGAPIVKDSTTNPFVSDASKDAAKDSTFDSTTGTKAVETKEEVKHEASIESLEKKVADCQTKLTEANDVAVKAHGELMNAQRELSRAKAN